MLPTADKIHVAVSASLGMYEWLRFGKLSTTNVKTLAEASSSPRKSLPKMLNAGMVVAVDGEGVLVSGAGLSDVGWSAGGAGHSLPASEALSVSLRKLELSAKGSAAAPVGVEQCGESAGALVWLDRESGMAPEDVWLMLCRGAVGEGVFSEL